LDIEEAEACEASTVIDAKTALECLADLSGLAQDGARAAAEPGRGSIRAD
jgi:hypothetical protein